MKDYQDRRTQTVLVEGKMSYLEHVKSGVPQGTVLGKLLMIFDW